MAVLPLIIIPSRLASTRLPNKALADIAGTPMIIHVLRKAQAAKIGPVAVACGDQELVDIVQAAGGQAVLTDPALTSGSDRVFAGSKLIDPEGKHDIIINVQGDLPNLDPEALRAVLLPLADPAIDIASLVAPIQSEEEANTPSVVKCVCAFKDGVSTARALYFSRNRVPSGAGPLWHHIGVYAFRRAALARFVALPPTAIEQRENLEQLRAMEAGMGIGVARVASAPLGVDTAADLETMRQIFSSRA